MMMCTISFLLISFISLTSSQIPNPVRYRLTATDASVRQHYAVDKQFYRLSRKGYPSDASPSAISDNQDVYVPSEGRTYAFNLNSSPPCIANRGAFLDNIDYWASVVRGYGGENKTYDEIIIDSDCDGACLTWSVKYDATAIGYHVDNRLYIRQTDNTPIKTTTILRELRTGQNVLTSVKKFSDWNLGEIPA
ncbi:hypothetical protein I4U23_003717 [Adineta vaga]|nr:hypothetical protein I4U23_003717 [Adineta vaga]